jgi:methylated-DNA-[protein]-cysteine S-methyltransferase
MNAIAMLMPVADDLAVMLAAFRTPLGTLHVASVPAGVCAVAFDDRRDTLEPRLRRMFGTFQKFEHGDPLDAGARLDAYFGGDLDALRDVPRATPATPMQRRVWTLVLALAAGTTTTYAALAARLGMPRAQRAVGVCLASNPLPLFVPCHRVIAASGAVAGYPGGDLRKRWLLRHEGVPLALPRAPGRARGTLDPADIVDLVVPRIER